MDIDMYHIRWLMLLLLYRVFNAKAVWCESEEMIADILTKALQGMQFEKLVLKMGICPVANQDT